MKKVNLTLSDVNKKYLKIIGYLTLSNGLGYVLANYVAKDALLTAVFGPTINFIVYLLVTELSKEGYRGIKK